MKVLAALATMAIAAVIGARAPQAAERTARLSDPAQSGPASIAPRGALENASLPSSVARTGLSSSELDRIRASIRDHIDAVTTHDGPSAYATLTPAIQDYYSDSNKFLKSMISELEPLATARTFSFSQTSREDTDALQSVVITGPQGREWVAEFRLQRQGDGSWAIQGCQVEAAQGRRT